MVKDSVGSLLLIGIFGLIACLGFAPAWLGAVGVASVAPQWPVLALGMAAAGIFTLWQPDGHPFQKRRKGFGFALSTVGVHLFLAALAFGIGHLASKTLFT